VCYFTSQTVVSEVRTMGDEVPILSTVYVS
jgi:hypothetical protein